MSDVTVEILQNIRAEIGELRAEMHAELRAVNERLDSHEARLTTVEYALQGIALDTKQILRLLRQVSDVVADHEERLDRLES